VSAQEEFASDSRVFYFFKRALSAQNEPIGFLCASMCFICAF